MVLFLPLALYQLPVQLSQFERVFVVLGDFLYNFIKICFIFVFEYARVNKKFTGLEISTGAFAKNSSFETRVIFSCNELLIFK
jgi:hypothetical protein